MAEFSIDVSELDEIGKDYSFPVTASWLVRELDGCPGVRGPASGTSDGLVEVHAQKSGGEFLVRGHVTATVVSECYRCLEDVSCTVTAELTALYAPAPVAKSAKGAPKEGKAGPAKGAKADDEADALAAGELATDEVEHETFSGDKLVLDALVREHVILEVPMQPLCREDCPGIPIPEHIRGPANFGEEESKGGALRAALSKLETKK